jgi:hypothetical protein
MQRLLGLLAVTAAALLTLAIMIGAGPFADQGWSAASLRGGHLTVDAVSFTFGFLSGLAAIWIVRIPWGALPRLIVAMLRGWRRNAVFLALACLSAGVLLFY